jgi:hypothetical protein
MSNEVNFSSELNKRLPGLFTYKTAVLIQNILVQTTTCGGLQYMWLLAEPVGLEHCLVADGHSVARLILNTCSLSLTKAEIIQPHLNS